MTGNEALAEGAIRAGCQCYFGYPITPQNELTAYMARHMIDRGRVFVQAESELAAIYMVFGAAAAGARCLTTSSSPGISLKQEGISYLAGAEVPAVIANIQRGGPGLGGIEPAQADYFQSTRGGGHGDYRTLVLAPDSVQEMHDFPAWAFELAERYRNPVLILSDGLLGQMMEPVVLRPEVTPAFLNASWTLTGAENRPPNVVRSLLIKEGELERHNLHLQEKYALAAGREARAKDAETEDADLLVVAWGSCARIASGAVALARAKGLAAGWFRPITLWPFPSARLVEVARRARAVLVVEMNAGQMVEDVRLALEGRVPVSFKGYLGSRIPRESEILHEMERLLA
jgi:2-oxoglutarate ferredoxin oxidoreductase subunit alpha